jgi:hypothetical protein
VADTTPIDDTLTAIPMVLGILAGEPGPWQVSEASFRGLAVLLIGTMRANVQLMGITDRDEQDALIRDQLEGMYEGATLMAWRHDGGLSG